MEGLELSCVELITYVGDARSSFIQAIGAAKKGDFPEAERLIAAGEESFINGHKVHGKLIQKAAGGELDNISLILVHAEDQLMSAETFKILVNEFIDVYRKMGFSDSAAEIL